MPSTIYLVSINRGIVSLANYQRAIASVVRFALEFDLIFLNNMTKSASTPRVCHHNHTLISTY